MVATRAFFTAMADSIFQSHHPSVHLALFSFNTLEASSQWQTSEAEENMARNGIEQERMAKSKMFSMISKQLLNFLLTRNTLQIKGKVCV